MSLLVRLSLILTMVLAAIGTGLWVLHRANAAVVQELQQERRDDRGRLWERAVQLQAVGLEALTSGYSWWNDMVRFVEKPDPKWASETVDLIVGSPGGGDALWVFDERWTLLHHIDAEYGRPAVPFEDLETLRAHLGTRYQFNFYTVRDGQVWQIFGAAIQDPSFWRHETPVRGYLLLGKRWDETWIARLGDLTQARLQVLTTPGASALPPPSRSFARTLTGLGGAPLAAVHGTVDDGEIGAVQDTLRAQFLVVSGGLLLLAAGALVWVAWAVLRPLSHLVRSLESRNPTPLADLLRARGPFGEAARLLASQFRQGRMLQDEIRRQLDVSNPLLAAREAETSEALRLRLASDLHDGPLQSLYAAGLKLGVLEARLRGGQTVHREELEHIRVILSESTVNLRNLLFDLEPEELRNHDLETALERLERYMRSLAGEFRLELEDHALEGIAREPQLHLFYICRELVSNAARHARPQHAQLSFERRDSFLRLEWTNDGILSPDASRKGGHGLHNIEQRVKRLDGTCEFGLHRAHVWHVTILLPYASLTAPLLIDSPR